MTAARTDARDTVLVTWVSVNHGAAPLLTALHESGSPLRSKVRRLYLCTRDAPGRDGDRERDATRASVDGLQSALGSACPEIIRVSWTTKASPTDHAAIRPFAESTLRRVRGDNPDSRVAILLSPGTPAMHAVWLLLGSTEFIPGPVEMFQAADERGRAAGQSVVAAVRIDLDTWLHRFRAARPAKVGIEDDGQAWDPSRVRSAALREALEKIEEWAPVRAPVLFVGERGTGKTTLANLLRSRSPYQKKGGAEWPTVVCGQFRVNPQLARSELFGHARGAFTGATKDRRGLLELADGDSLFLDEIGDIDRDTQRLLIAAVEGRGFQRLGDATLRPSRFRLICATNLPLAQLRSELLDPDFYDRIATFILDVPPLRNCAEDLPDAWARTLRGAIRRADVPPDGWEAYLDHPRLLKAIAAHLLPGNFRDLQRAALHIVAALLRNREEPHVVRTAVAALDSHELSDGVEMMPDDLCILLPLKGDLRDRIAAYEAAWLRAAMERASGNKSEAARLLGMPRKTFEHRWRAAVRSR